MWPPPNTTNTSYGFQSAATQQQFGPSRGIFSPSLNSIIRGNPTPTATEGLPPPPYEVPQYSAAQMPMSAPSLPSAPPQQHMISNAMMGGQPSVSAPVSHASPVSAQEAFARPPPTPTYYNNSQPPSAAPPQGAFSYPPGPSPVQQSPVSGAGSIKMSPVNGAGPMPPLQSQSAQFSRPYTYPLPGPVLSNVNNPGGQLQMVGGLPHGMVPGGFNSGHAAHMQQIYGHPQQQNQQNDRPFRCDQCPQSFNRNHDLKRHKRIHLAVKPFPCGHCDKSFSRKDALKVSSHAPILLMSQLLTQRTETRSSQRLRQSTCDSRSQRDRWLCFTKVRKLKTQSCCCSFGLRGALFSDFMYMIFSAKTIPFILRCIMFVTTTLWL